jgi:hypothetical protein
MGGSALAWCKEDSRSAVIGDLAKKTLNKLSMGRSEPQYSIAVGFLKLQRRWHEALKF